MIANRDIKVRHKWHFLVAAGLMQRRQESSSSKSSHCVLSRTETVRHINILSFKTQVLICVILVPHHYIDALYDKWTPEQAQSLLELSWTTLKTDKSINLDPKTQTKEERYFLSEGIIQNNAVSMKQGGNRAMGVCLPVLFKCASVSYATSRSSLEWPASTMHVQVHKTWVITGERSSGS